MTRWSMLRQARSEAEPTARAALDELCRTYWKPIYAYFRRARADVGNEEAKDLTQAFLLDLLEGGLLGRYRPEQGTFRAYLRGALRLYLLEHRRRQSAARRGGGRRILSIDEAEIDRIDDLAAGRQDSPEEAFDAQWIRTLIDLAVADLEAELTAAGRPIRFEVFDRYELRPPPAGPPTQARLAADLGLTAAEVAGHLAACRNRLRHLVARRIEDTVAEPGEVASEMFRCFR